MSARQRGCSTAPITTVGLVAALAVGLWCARRERVPSSDEVVAPTPSTSAVAAGADAAATARSRGAASEARTPADSASASRLQPATPVPGARTARSVEVEVRCALDREPLGGARVWLRHSGMSDEPDAQEAQRRGWPTYLAAWATSVVAGADGRTRIDGVVGTPQLVATWEHLQGASRAPLNDGGFATVLLAPRFEPELRIVDACGAPAIGAKLRYADAARPERNFEISIEQSRFPLVNHIDIARGHEVWLHATPFGGPAQAFRLDRNLLVENPTTLVLANTGQLEVRVVGLPPSGALPQRMKFELGLATEQAQSRGGRVRALGGTFAGRTYHGTLVDGRATCAAIAPGLELVVGVDVPGIIGPRPHVRCAGPAHAGEVAVVDVPIAAWAVLGGRALDGDGRAITSSSLRVEWDGGWAIDTDAAGRFAVPISRAADESDMRVLELRHRSYRALVDLPPLSARDIDLGDVVFAPATTLASGRVVDRDGRAIVGATVKARVEGAAIAETDTAAGGQFELRAFAPQPRFEVCAEHAAFLANCVDAELGARDLVLALDPGSWLRARVLLDGPQVGPLMLRLARVGEEATAGVGLESGDDFEASAPDSMGPRERTYSWPGLAAGTYALGVRLAGDRPDERIPLASEHARIALALGEQRTIEIDLRGRVTSVRVRVLGDDGTALPGATVNGAEVDEDGRASLSASSPQPEIEAACHGWLTQRVVLPAEEREHEIRLTRATAIRFVLSAPAISEGERLEWYAIDRADPRRAQYQVLSDRTAAEVSWLPDRAGRFAIEAAVIRRNRYVARVALDPPVELDVAAGDAPRTVQLRITQAALDQARKQLEANQK